MAVYKIFPTRDATLYSAYPNMNTGDDAILEVSNTFPDINPSPRVARSIIDFEGSHILEVWNNHLSSSNDNWQAYLRLYAAEVSGIDQDTKLETVLISGSFDNGSGQFNDKPQSTNGVSWNWRYYSSSGAWDTPGGDILDTTSSYSPVTQSFDKRTVKDLNVNVKELVEVILGEDSLVLYGRLVSAGQDAFMVKLSDSQENISGSANQPSFKFFSVDTNTIYPPQLEFRWNDFVTSSTAPSEITTSDLQVALDSNPGIFYSESINRFRLNVRPEFPVRTFQTASLYTTNFSLPTASYYAVKDLDTNEYVIDFDTSYTKISNDNSGSYFDLYMNGLEPERYYKILIQTTVDGSTMVKDEDYIFKVVNG